MISDPTLFVECDYCHSQVDFSFSHVLNNPDVWMDSPRFDGWYIDWQGADGDAMCPECKASVGMSKDEND